jgi:two-component system response regulator
MNDSTIDVLLVEDSEGDIELARVAIEQSKLLVNLHVVNDGVAAMKYLRKQGGFTRSVRPDLVILDLNLPKKDGREVLQEIKMDEDLRSIPVVILTLSSSEEDMEKAYYSGANTYITKPIDFSQFVKVVHSIEEFWFKIAKLPAKRS